MLPINLPTESTFQMNSKFCFILFVLSLFNLPHQNIIILKHGGVYQVLHITTLYTFAKQARNHEGLIITEARISNAKTFSRRPQHHFYYSVMRL